MDRNPFSKPTFGTLDETVVRPGEVVPRFGWRWALSCLYLIGLSTLIFVVVLLSEIELAGQDLPEVLLNANGILFLIVLLITVLLISRTQAGWVGATMIVSGMIVLSTIGFVVQFIPTIEPVTDGRWARLATSGISVGLACFVFYLLSHPRLRAGFRIPQSWIRRCVTLGGLLGTGVGMWLIWLATRGVDPGMY